MEEKQRKNSMRQVILKALRSNVIDNEEIIKLVQNDFPERDAKSIKASILVHKGFLKKEANKVTV